MESDENRIVIGGGSQRIVVSKTVFCGDRVIDIRKWYFNKKSKEWCPTQKGIALKAQNFGLLISAISQDLDGLQDWFADEGDKLLSSLTLDSSRRHSALVEECAIKTEVEKIPWRDLTIAKLVSFGGVQRLFINSNARFDELVEELTERVRSQRELGLVIINTFCFALEKTVNLLDDESRFSGEEIKEIIRNNIGSYYIKAFRSLMNSRE